jgi:uncharacterized RDD family membrane protein YckC
MENLTPAGIGPRFAAYLIDIIPVVLLSFVVLYLVNGADMFNSDRKDAMDSVRALGLMLWIFYCAIMESTSYQGTIGKRLMDIKVVNASGGRLTVFEAIIRNITKLLSSLPLGLGFFWMLFNKKKKCWHDMLSGAWVVRDEEKFRT